MATTPSPIATPVPPSRTPHTGEQTLLQWIARLMQADAHADIAVAAALEAHNVAVLTAIKQQHEDAQEIAKAIAITNAELKAIREELSAARRSSGIWPIFRFPTRSTAPNDTSRRSTRS
jgi:hypothetical protein